MRDFTISSTAKNKIKSRIYIFTGAIILVALFFVSLLVGKFPLSFEKVLEGDELHVQVFWTLRFSRAFIGCVGGFTLAIAGFVFQTIFRNPLASPDIIGVSSGASAGAALGILIFDSMFATTFSSFVGALLAVILALAIASIDRTGRKGTVILAGIAVHSLAQTVLMCLKMMADPEKQLASIEYWIMGSLNAIQLDSIGVNVALCVAGVVVLLLLHRQMLMLAADEGEARMLGVEVTKIRLLILLIATLVVAAVVSLTGLISFIGLLAPHCARKLTHANDKKTMLLAGILGGCILVIADILARSVASTELPISIFTSIIGAPFLVFLIAGRRNQA